MDRRSYLALLTAGLAGCAGGPARTPSTSTEPPESSPTDEPTGSAPTTTPSGTRTPVESERTTLESNEPYRTEEGWTVRLSVYRARRAILEAGKSGGDVVFPPNRQFLQVGVDTAGDGAPDPSDLCLVGAVDGERPFEGCTARIEAIGSDVGTVQSVPVPLSFDGETAAVVWERSDGTNVRWRAGDRTVRALKHPPEFVVEGLEVPETAAAGEEFEVGITIRNTGGRRDWFVAELGVAATPDAKALELAYGAGEKLTKPRTLVADFGDDDELVVRLDWELDAIERTVKRA